MSARAASASARPLQRPAGRRPPRRYSGPAKGFPAAGAATAPSLAPAPRPRRAHPAPPARWTARAALSQQILLTPRRLLSLRLRGRGWIAFVAFALLGIVTMQLVVLRLNTEIGRALQHATSLQREDAALAITNSEAGSGESIESMARSLGMVAQAPGDLKFLHAAGYGRAEAAAQALLSEHPSSSVSLNSEAGSLSSGFVTPSSGETAVPGATTTSASEPAPQSTQPAQASTQAASSEGATGEAATTTSSPASSAATTQTGSSTEPSSTAPSTTAPSTTGAPSTSVTAAGGAQAGAGG